MWGLLVWGGSLVQNPHPTTPDPSTESSLLPGESCTWAISLGTGLPHLFVVQQRNPRRSSLVQNRRVSLCKPSYGALFLHVVGELNRHTSRMLHLPIQSSTSMHQTRPAVSSAPAFSNQSGTRPRKMVLMPCSIHPQEALTIHTWNVERNVKMRMHHPNTRVT